MLSPQVGGNMRLLGLAGFLSLASMCGAQQPSVSSKDELVTLANQRLAQAVRGSCPVELSVHQQARPPLVYTDTSRAVHPAYQIDVYARGGKQVSEVAVHLVGPTGLHLEWVDSGQQNEDATESHVLTKISNINVKTRTLTALRWVDVISITYADGSSWQPKSQESCRVFPQGVSLLQ